MTEEELAEGTIKPIYLNAIKNDYSFAKYGVECYLTGYNKANEWHFVKDGKYPKENEAVVCFCKGYCGVNYGITARLVIGVDGVYRWWTLAGEGKSEQLINVIAWKEIVLPELPKE